MKEPHEVFSGDVVQFGIPVVENSANSEKVSQDRNHLFTQNHVVISFETQRISQSPAYFPKTILQVYRTEIVYVFEVINLKKGARYKIGLWIVFRLNSLLSGQRLKNIYGYPKFEGEMFLSIKFYLVW